MSQNPLNLALRFLLELGALFAIGYWGWNQSEKFPRIVLAIGLPLLWAVVWGVFRVPGDTSASGRALVAVPGWLRLSIELAFFAFATWGLFKAGAARAGWMFGSITLVHILISYDRVAWLVKQ